MSVAHLDNILAELHLNKLLEELRQDGSLMLDERRVRTEAADAIVDLADELAMWAALAENGTIGIIGTKKRKST
jgi:hypothetical protein